MGNYSEQLTAEEHRNWVKRVQIWLIKNDLTRRDLAEMVGYSYKTVVDSLNYYDRCSRFFVAAVNDKMG